MSQDEAFLQTIIDAPDDDAPRLVYADFLEENGDRDRAEFIRVQCALDKMPPAAPARTSLVAQEKQLLEKHGWDWAAPFGMQISEWVFRRGFIERVQMCLETSAESIVSVLNKAPIRHVRESSEFCDFQGVVEALPHLGRLTGLEFWGLYACEDQLAALVLSSPHLRNLRTLILHHDRNGNLLDEKVLIEAMVSPYRANLQELGVNIDGCWRGPSRGILQAMAKSPCLTNLKKLVISEAGDIGNSAQMDVETVRAMGASANFAGLEELDMGRTSFTLEVWDEVLKWPWLSRLKWLRLHYARQVEAPEYFYTVAEIKNLPDYRKAFENLAGRVDWDTEFISPWDGTTCWRGLTWQDRPRQLLFSMDRFVRSKDYEGLEAHFRQLCEKLDGAELTRQIDELPFDRYEADLHAGFRQAVANAAASASGCIFLRQRPDVEWQGKFHVHDADPNIMQPREEFSYSPGLEIDGPNFPHAARLYEQRPLFSGIQPSGTALYLLARTVAAFGRCIGDYSLPISVYFSCMYVVLCIKSAA